MIELWNRLSSKRLTDRFEVECEETNDFLLKSTWKRIEFDNLN